MEKLKFAIVGCGRISYRHIEAIADNNLDIELVGVSDVLPERMERLINNYCSLFKDKKDIDFQNIKRYINYKEMLKKTI